MPDEPKPSLEDIVRDWGYDKMEFFHEMVRPDQHEEREEDTNVPAARTPPDHTPEEARAIVEGLEKYFGRKPTQQEINLALKQAHDIGYL